MQSCCGALEEGETADEGLRGVFEEWGHLGTSANVPGVRPCGLLRLVTEPARSGAFPGNTASADSVRGKGRGLEVVLYR
jgi:hypothetical protein